MRGEEKKKRNKLWILWILKSIHYYHCANKGENRILLETHLTVAFFSSCSSLFLVFLFSVPSMSFLIVVVVDVHSFLRFCLFIFLLRCPLFTKCLWRKIDQRDDSETALGIVYHTFHSYSIFFYFIVACSVLKLYNSFGPTNNDRAENEERENENLFHSHR